MWRRIARVLRSWPVLTAAGVFGLYLLSGFLLVNPLAQRALPWAGERFLGSRLQAQRVDFNPLTLELRVQGLTLAEPDGAPLAGFSRLYANLDVDGLAHWAWHLREADVEQPQARVELRSGGRSNWSELLAKLQSPESGRIVRVAIDRLRLSGGKIEFIDRDRAGEPYQARFTPLGIELESVSTLPEDSGDYLLTARLPEEGAVLRWKGELTLNPLASRGELSLEGARIGKLARAARRPLAALPSGTASAKLQYRFAMLHSPEKKDVPELQVSGGTLQLQDFALLPQGGGEPMLQVAKARIEDASLDLVRHEFRVGALVLEGGKVAAMRDAQGALDWAAVLVAPEAGEADRRLPAVQAMARAGSETPWRFSVRDVRLSDWAARWEDRGFEQPLVASVQGVQVSGAIEGVIGQGGTISIGPVNGTTGPVQLSSGGEPVAQLQRATLANARTSLPLQRIDVEAIALDGARTEVALDKQQRLNWSAILRRSGPQQPATADSSALPELKVARLAAADLQVGLVDASTRAPVRLDIEQGTLLLRDVGLDLARPMPVEATFRVKQGGRFEAKGMLVPSQPAGEMQVALSDLSLKPFAPYVNAFAQLRLDAGAAGTRGKLVFKPGPHGISLAYNGAASVDGLAIVEEDTGDPFLGWKRLSSESVQVTLGPDGAHVGELVAVNPVGKVIIFEDQTLNLQRIRRAPANAPAVTTTAATTAPPAQSPAFPLTIDRLRVDGGTAEFADLSLTPQFGTRMHDLRGVVVGLSTDPAASAQVELDGQVDDYGSARIRGSIQPFRATENTDLTLAFRNLEMTRLTPYSGKFAGRKIESGRLSVDLEYKVKQRQLAGTNKFVVNKLKLGEPVDSPTAMKLPLDLAIAVLQDSDGVIDLDLPVSGSLDDPKFSYGAIIWKAIVNVLTKIVTAPFRALGALLGADTEKYEAAGFDPGSTVLLPPEQEKLKVLSEALAKRPALSLSIAPGYDPQADRRALQEAVMRQQAATIAGVKPAAGEPPGPVDVNNHKVQGWLEEKYEKAAGAGEYQKLREKYKGKPTVTDNAFVERVGRVFSTRDDGPPSAFHAELLDRLTAQVPIDDEALVALAQARAKAVREALLKLGLDEAQVTVAEPKATSVKNRMVASGLALGAGSAQRAPLASAPTISLMERPASSSALVSGSH